MGRTKKFTRLLILVLVVTMLIPIGVSSAEVTYTSSIYEVVHSYNGYGGYDQPTPGTGQTYTEDLADPTPSDQPSGEPSTPVENTDVPKEDPTTPANTPDPVNTPEPVKLPVGDGKTIAIYINGERLATDVDPYIDEQQRTQVPFRAIGEALGAKVQWVGHLQQVIVSKGDKMVIMTIGKKNYFVNNTTYAMDTTPTLKNNRTFIPLRALGEALDCQVSWDTTTKTVTISTEAQK